MRNSSVRAITILAFVACAAHAAPDDSAKRWRKPKRVTFAHKQVALSAVLKDFQTQFGETVALQELKGDRLVDLEAKMVTYYEALDQLAEINGLAVLLDKRDNLALTAHFKGMVVPPVVHLGPTRLSVQQALRTKDWNGAELLKIELRWLGPPGLTCAWIDLKLNKVVDDEGKVHKRLEPKRYDGFPFVPNDELVLHLTAPSKTATKIVSLSGTATLAFPAKFGTVVFKKKEFGKRKRLGQSAIFMEKVDASPAMIHFTVTGWTCTKFRGGDHDRPWVVLQTKGGSRQDPGTPGLADLAVSCFAKDKTGIGASADSGYSAMIGEPVWNHRIGLKKSPERIVFRAVTKLKTKEVRFSFPNVLLE